MAGTLSATRSGGGVEFRVAVEKALLPPDQWAHEVDLRTEAKRPARVGVLFRLVEDGEAQISGDAIAVPHRAIAAMDDFERMYVGLPPTRSVLLELEASGAFSDAGFEIRRRLLHADGRPIVAPRLEGCFLRIGADEFILAEPLYSLWTAVERFNATHRDIEGRMLAWGEIRAQLPEDVRLGDDLERVRIALATAFTLNPFRNERGEPDFDPVLGRWTEKREHSGASTRGFDEVIPAARQRDFAKRYRELSMRGRYAVGGGTFVVLAPALERALRAVHEIQRADAGTRRRFLTRPSTVLRNALEATLPEPAEAERDESAIDDANIVDEVFFDEGLSERVKGIGVWEPKVLPWLKPSGEQWLPGDEAGIAIGDEHIPVPPPKAAELLEKVREAIQKGEESVDFDGKQIPATKQMEEALEELIAATKERSKSNEPEGSKAEQGPRLALLIIDNLEQLGFQMEPRPARAASDRLPGILATLLLPHQEIGLRWLQEHWRSGSAGALLADDMGLGKTLQALAFLAWLREEMDAGVWPRRPFLVVAPTGLLRNWRDEHNRHLEVGGLGRLTEAYGSGLRSLRAARDVEGRELATGLPSLDIAELARADWVTTTFETLRDYQHSFARVRWAVAIFDEAQKIKNPAAGLTDAAKAMKQDFTLVMTGTPVENRIEDLWCIVDAARPGGLGALKDFSARFRGDPDEQQRNLEDLREALVSRSRPAIMLRRMKEDHLDGLPEKKIHVHRRPMPAGQANAYADAVRAAKSGAPMLQVLQHLRSASLHPLTDGTHESDTAFIDASARVDLAFEILDPIHARDEKALIFLESRPVQDMLAELLQRRYRLRERVLIINGEVSGSSRKLRVDEFQKRKGFDVMILSPRAGGVGLTLTAANHVIHLARWWNPAVEDQCTDRVHRIGQEKTVHVHHVLAVHPEYGENSFDLRLASLIERKRVLNRAVLMPAAATNEELRELYRATVDAPSIK